MILATLYSIERRRKTPCIWISAASPIMAFVPSPIVAHGVHGVSHGVAVPRPSASAAGGAGSTSSLTVAGSATVAALAAAQRGKRLARRAERAKAVATEEDEDVGYRSVAWIFWIIFGWD